MGPTYRRLAALQIAVVLAGASAPAHGAAPARPPQDPAVWVAPPVDVGLLLAEDAVRRLEPGVADRIGFPMDVDLAPDRAGSWTELAGGDRVWRLSVVSEGALWLVLGFDRFRLQPGASLAVTDETGTTRLGPYTAADIRPHGELWLPPVAGDELSIELHWPAARSGETPDLHLGTVSHGYRPFGPVGRPPDAPPGGADLEGSGSCNIDLACPLGAAWQDAKRGVVALLSGGSAFCTGSLINTTADDCRPYVLTAAHCSPGPSTTFGFNFERPGCNSGTPPPVTAQTVSGATVLASFSTSDFNLLEMDSQPPESFGVYYNGWSRDPAAAAQAWGIHHPSGDVKKISHNDDPLVDGSNWGANHWRVTEWELGTTEPGSSGSPLFDSAQRIVGQLHGGTASCTSITWDEYGKVAASWTGNGTMTGSLAPWLDPDPTGALTMNGVDFQTCLFQPAGVPELDRELYGCDDLLVVRVRDDQLKGQTSLDVTVASTTESAPETLELTPIEPGSGTFAGSLVTTAAPPVAGDGQLSVSHGDTITVTYVDADDGAGGSDVVVETLAAVDCASPVITNVRTTAVAGSSATVLWDTDEPADSRVTWGDALPPALVAADGDPVTAHSVRITGLTPCRVHYYEVASADPVGNDASDDNLGVFYEFETGVDVEPTFDATDTPVSIPDNSSAGASSTIVVADDSTVLDVNVSVTITHTYTGDLVLRLVPPVGSPILLANRRGGNGDDFGGTLFDDEAATPIASGTAPFAGAFRPDQQLSAADGISAQGAWRLEVVDQAGADVGQIVAFRLHLTFPAQACGPHASFDGTALEEDVCAAGGAGDSDGTWDPGERITFSVRLANDGSEALSGIVARLTPVTPGIVALDAEASFPPLAPGESAGSLAPHFSLALPDGLACGDPIELAIEIDAGASGTWSDAFAEVAGRLLPGGGIALSESFEAGVPPAGFSVVNGGSNGATWYADSAADPAGCANGDPNPPLAGGWAAVDSDCTGAGVSMDEQLVTPVLDLSQASGVTLEFDHYLRQYQQELSDVDVRSSLTGGSWINVARYTATTPNPQHVLLDLTAHAAGASDVEVRWRYWQADFEWYWYLDNVTVSFSAPGGCEQTPCSAAGAAPAPAGDGSDGSDPLRVGRLADDGSLLELSWDADCDLEPTHVIWGPLASVASYAIGGSACGVASPAVLDPAPAGAVWFLVVRQDAAGVESSWGESSSGERNGLTPSGECGTTSKDPGGSCP